MINRNNEDSAESTPAVTSEMTVNTPVLQTPVRGRMSGMFSPGGRKLLSNLGSARKDSPVVASAEILNDDQFEKMRKILDSAKKKKAMESRGVPQDQMSEHYYSCLKMAAENKITTKNAFNLHLIDYMDDMLLKTDEVDFQLAGLSLEAGSKIFAYRVDALQKDIYRMVDTLNRMIAGADGKRRTSDHQMHAEDGEDGGGGGDVSLTSVKPRKKNETVRRKPKKTIETNLKNISLEDSEMNLEMDTFFQRIKGSFEPGNTTKLLMNSFHTWNDHSELILDPRRIVDPRNQTPILRQGSNSMVDIGEFSEIFSHILRTKPRICPSFEHFQFGVEGEDIYKSHLNKGDLERFRFDPNSEPSCPIEVAMDTDDNHDDFHDDFHDDNDIRLSLQDTTNLPTLEETISLVRNRDVSAIKEAMTERPEVYVSFLKKFLKEVDPAKWKALQEKEINKEEDNKTKQKKRVKVDFSVTFDDEEKEEVDRHFEKRRRATIQSWEKLMNVDEYDFMLPGKMPFNWIELTQLYFMPDTKIDKQSSPGVHHFEFEGGYNYDNQHDKSYFPDDDDASMGMPDGDEVLVEDEIPMAENEVSLTTTQMKQNLKDVMDSQESRDLFIGNNLVPEPRKIPRIQIDYDKVAKNIDVKKLRTTMSSTISGCLKSTEMICLSEVMTSMSDDLPKATRDDLSVHIAFFCLLNLANEQNFKLTSKEDLSDISIFKTN